MHNRIFTSVTTVAFLVVSSVTISAASVIYFWPAQEDGVAPMTGDGVRPYEGKKVLYVDSYHEGYDWSDGITRGLEEVLAGTGVELKIVRMDTKRNLEEEYKRTSGAAARDEIERFLPDVVIVSDDNAFKYVVQEYYRDADMPIVFCGLNWDASLYGVPYRNTTGMVEVSLTQEIIVNLRAYARGDRVGYLSADTETERKNALYYEKLFGLRFARTSFVTTMQEWEGAFEKMQQEVDMLVFENNAGIADWDDARAESFALSHVKIPVGTTNSWTMKESLIGLTKVPEEQGEWSAKAALDILGGTSPSSIPEARNGRGRNFVNFKMAKALGIVLRPELIKISDILR